MDLLPPQLHASCKLDIALHGQCKGWPNTKWQSTKKNGWNNGQFYPSMPHLVVTIVAHVCGDPPCRATLVALHMSQQISWGFHAWQWYRICYTSPQEALSHPSRVNCQGCRTSSCLSKGVALQGGVATTLASIALHCATMVVTHSTETLPSCDFQVLVLPFFYTILSFMWRLGPLQCRFRPMSVGSCDWVTRLCKGSQRKEKNIQSLKNS